MTGNNNHKEIFVPRRIKELRLAKGLTQKAFAASLGIVQGYLSGIERGNKIPSYTLLMALCHIYGVSEGWLSGETAAESVEKPQSREHLPGGVTAGIPLLKGIPSGFPAEIGKAEISSYLCFPDCPEGCFAIIAEGDFMAPTIQDGDLVIFKPGEDIGNRSIVLMTNRWGEVILRRFRVKGDEEYYASENAAYAPFKAAANTRIFGSVVDVWRKVKI